MNWNDKAAQQFEQQAAQNMTRACLHLVNTIREMISTPSRTVSVGANGKKKLGPRGSSRSLPGEPPHKDTGALRSSIAHQVTSPTRALVGSAAKVARWMELGTPGGAIIRPVNKKVLANKHTGQIFGKRVVQGAIAPRPFLRRALAEQRATILAIIGGSGGKT